MSDLEQISRIRQAYGYNKDSHKEAHGDSCEFLEFVPGKLYRVLASLNMETVKQQFNTVHRDTIVMFLRIDESGFSEFLVENRKLVFGGSQCFKYFERISS